MMLYYCPQCGRWQDVSLLQKISTFVDNLVKVMDQPLLVDRPDGFACPDGHGFMVSIAPSDRIMLRMRAQPLETGESRLVLLKSECPVAEESETTDDE